MGEGASLVGSRGLCCGHPGRESLSRQLRVCRKGGVPEDKARAQVSFCAGDAEKLLFVGNRDLRTRGLRQGQGRAQVYPELWGSPGPGPVPLPPGNGPGPRHSSALGTCLQVPPAQEQPALPLACEDWPLDVDRSALETGPSGWKPGSVSCHWSGATPVRLRVLPGKGSCLLLQDPDKTPRNLSGGLLLCLCGLRSLLGLLEAK